MFRIQSYKMDKYSVLDRINYKTLDLRSKPDPPNVGKNVKTLMYLVVEYVCLESELLLEKILMEAPSLLAPILLKEAILQKINESVKTIIANWPLKILSFGDLGLDNSKLFLKESMLDLFVFKGLIYRTNRCCLNVVDFRGLNLNDNFARAITTNWPFFSLRRNDMNLEKLASVMKSNLIIENYDPYIDYLEKMMLSLSDLEHLHQFGYQDFKFPDQKIQVYLDKIVFSTNTSLYLEYSVVVSLQSITRVNVRPNNIVIRSEIDSHEQTYKALGLFSVLQNHHLKGLNGISLEDIGDDVLYRAIETLTSFSLISCLALVNCNIFLQEGITRNKTASRRHLIELFSMLKNLTRLDLSENTFCGCLRELLESLKSSLEYLSLRDCNLHDKDLQYLVTSHHASSLLEINFNRICGLFRYDDYAVSVGTLLESIQHFPTVNVLSLSRNQFTDEDVESLMNSLSSLKYLKALNISGNFFSEECVLSILKVCCKLSSIQHMCLPYSLNIFQALHAMYVGRASFRSKITDIITSHGHPNMSIYVSGCPLADLIIGVQ